MGHSTVCMTTYGYYIPIPVQGTVHYRSCVDLAEVKRTRPAHGQTPPCHVPVRQGRFRARLYPSENLYPLIFRRAFRYALGRDFCNRHHDVLGTRYGYMLCKVRSVAAGGRGLTATSVRRPGPRAALPPPPPGRGWSVKDRGGQRRPPSPAGRRWGWPGGFIGPGASSATHKRRQSEMFGRSVFLLSIARRRALAAWVAFAAAAAIAGESVEPNASRSMGELSEPLPLTALGRSVSRVVVVANLPGVCRGSDWRGELPRWLSHFLPRAPVVVWDARKWRYGREHEAGRNLKCSVCMSALQDGTGPQSKRCIPAGQPARKRALHLSFCVCHTPTRAHGELHEGAPSVLNA